MKRKPAAEGHDAGQLVLTGQSGVQGQGPTLRTNTNQRYTQHNTDVSLKTTETRVPPHLRETTEDDPVWGDPIFSLVFDDGLDCKENRNVTALHLEINV